MIIIPGIAKSGTSYLSRKIHESGVKMFNECDEHYEDKDIANFLKGILITQFGYDKWHHGKSLKLLPYSVQEWTVNQLREGVLKRDLGGFKNPRLIHFLPELIKKIPQAKFIICYRELHSWLKSNERHGRNLANWENRLREHYGFCREMIKTYRNNKNVFIFYYDDGDWKGHQKSLNNFLGFDIDMSDFKPRTYE